MLLSLVIFSALAGSPGTVRYPVSTSVRPDSGKVLTWNIDPTHSELSFRIRHLVSRVRGTFAQWGGIITADPADWGSGKVAVTIQAASVTTQNERRDNDLRSPNFFDAATYPTLTFKSTQVKMNGDAISITGDLTIRNVTKSVVLEGSLLGLGKGQRGEPRVGFEVTTRINRLDYGVAWNRAVEGGGMLLGDDVEIDIVIAASAAQTT